jgi:hypothetical protein
MLIGATGSATNDDRHSGGESPALALTVLITASAPDPGLP